MASLTRPSKGATNLLPTTVEGEEPISPKKGVFPDTTSSAVVVTDNEGEGPPPAPKFSPLRRPSLEPPVTRPSAVLKPLDLSGDDGDDDDEDDDEGEYGSAMLGMSPYMKTRSGRNLVLGSPKRQRPPSPPASPSSGGSKEEKPKAKDPAVAAPYTNSDSSDGEPEKKADKSDEPDAVSPAEPAALYQHVASSRLVGGGDMMDPVDEGFHDEDDEEANIPYSDDYYPDDGHPNFGDGNYFDGREEERGLEGDQGYVGDFQGEQGGYEGDGGYQGEHGYGESGHGYDEGEPGYHDERAYISNDPENDPYYNEGYDPRYPDEENPPMYKGEYPDEDPERPRGDEGYFEEKTRKRDRRLIWCLAICLCLSMTALVGLVGGVLGALVFAEDKSSPAPAPTDNGSPTPPAVAPTPAPVRNTPTPVRVTPAPVAVPASPAPIPATAAPAEPTPAPVVTTLAPVPTTAPTERPAPKFEATNQALFDLIDAATPDSAALRTPNAPANLAYLWLQDEDPLTNTQRRLQALPDSRILQRFAMATFYFATGGPSWLRHEWLTGANECFWGSDSVSGINCDTTQSLAVLEFQANNLVGTLPREMGLMTNLVTLIVEGGGLTGGIPVELNQLLKIDNVLMRGHNFTEPLPDELFRGWSLAKVVNLVDNQLPGSIPTSVEALTSLQRLHLSKNLLNGELPTQLGNMTSLMGLYLSDNQLQGSIPSEMGQLTSLANGLDLSYNNLEGPLPDVWGNMPQIRMFRVNDNRLVGPVPSSMSSWSQMVDFRIQANALTGAVTCDALRPGTVLADCEEVECACCTTCCVDGTECSSR